ncbi:MAG: hypothetical protein ACLP9L_24020 [Thermoguttaceae bacterium]
MRLLRFLDLIDDHANLRSDVLDSRGNLNLFEQLLGERLRRGLERAGIPPDLCRGLGSKERAWSQLRGDLESRAPIKSLTSNVRNNVIGSLKALDEVLRHITDDGWLINQVQATDLRGRATEVAPIHGLTGTHLAADSLAAGESTRINFFITPGGDDLTAEVVLRGRVRDRSAALRKVADLLLKMAEN